MAEKKRDVKTLRDARIGDKDVTAQFVAAKQLSCPGDCKSLKVIWEVKTRTAGEFLSVRF